MASCHFVILAFKKSRIKIRLVTLSKNLRKCRRRMKGNFSRAKREVRQWHVWCWFYLGD